jgi:hypothetical protein
MTVLQGKFDLLLRVRGDLVVAVEDVGEICIQIQIFERPDLGLEIGDLSGRDASPDFGLVG